MVKRNNSFLRLQKSDILSCELFLGIPSFVRKSRAKGAAARGLRYEREVQGLFCERYRHYIASPWFQYRLRAKPRMVCYAQPDGLLVDPESGLVTIVEIKYAHVSDAYFQLCDKYLPLIQHFFAAEASWRFALCEVVRWYDVATDFPTQVVLKDDIVKARPGQFAVHVCKP